MIRLSFPCWAYRLVESVGIAGGVSSMAVMVIELRSGTIVDSCGGAMVTRCQIGFYMFWEQRTECSNR